MFDDNKLGRNYPEWRCCGFFLSLVLLVPWGGMVLGNLDVWGFGGFLSVKCFRLANWFIPLYRLLLRLGLCPVPHV